MIVDSTSFVNYKNRQDRIRLPLKAKVAKRVKRNPKEKARIKELPKAKERAVMAVVKASTPMKRANQLKEKVSHSPRVNLGNLIHPRARALVMHARQ